MATWLFCVLTSSVISPPPSANIILFTQALLYFNPTSSPGIISLLSVQMRGTLLDPRGPHGAAGAEDSTSAPHFCSSGSYVALILLWVAPWKVIFHFLQQQRAVFLYEFLKIECICLKDFYYFVNKRWHLVVDISSDVTEQVVLTTLSECANADHLLETQITILLNHRRSFYMHKHWQILTLTKQPNCAQLPLWAFIALIMQHRDAMSVSQIEILHPWLSAGFK